ncbi:MAG: hypothetical protein ACI8YC_001533 [Salibacteraceae bacterium]|jgi:hypothetical protein
MLQKSLFIILILGLAMHPLDVLAKEKIVDKSGKKPKWVKAEQTDLLRIQVKSQTLFASKMKAKDQFEKSLNTAIVYKLDARSDSLRKNRISDFITHYHWSDIKGKSFAKIYGIHDTLLADIYWEKYRLSKGGYLFSYSALFNCSNEEIDKIASQFELLDTKITSRLNPIKSKIDQKNSISWMFAAKDTLFSILEVAPQNYHGKILSMIKKLELGLDLVQIKILQKDNNLLKIQVTINGSAIPLEYNPKVSSTCAKVKSTALYDNYCTIYFDSSYCLTQDPESGFKVELGYRNQVLRRSILIF